MSLHESYDQPLAVANMFIELSDKRIGKRRSLDILKLQKLVYLAYGFYAAMFDDYLFSEEFQAWQYGPVLPSLYFRFNTKSSRPIEKIQEIFDLDTAEPYPPTIEGNEEEKKSVIKAVFRHYGGKDGVALLRITHLSGGPWRRTYDPNKREVRIPPEMIKSYFKETLTQNNKQKDLTLQK